MIYNDIVSIIGNVPDGYEWIYSVVCAVILCMYIYTFIRIIVNMFSVVTK